MTKNSGSELGEKFQLDTPTDWIINGKMFRLKTWELQLPEIEECIKKYISGPFSLSQIKDKEGELKGITLLYVDTPTDAEKIRKILLITSGGTKLRKMPRKISLPSTTTLKTTAPTWASKQIIREAFAKYNTDPGSYNLIVDQNISNNVSYPIVRFFQRKIERNGRTVPAVVVYIEFSPRKEFSDDSYVALSMVHRLEIKNPISGEKATLVFENWISDKEIVTQMKEKRQLRRNILVAATRDRDVTFPLLKESHKIHDTLTTSLTRIH